MLAKGVLSNSRRLSPHLLVPGTRRMSTSQDKFPSWMYGSFQKPEVVFHQLKAEDKEVLQLLQLMLIEVNKKNEDGLKLVLGELSGIADKQRDLNGLMHLLLFLFAGGAAGMYFVSQKLKYQTIELSTNVTAHSDEIIAALVDAWKYGTIGLGKPFKVQPKWFEPVEEVGAQKPPKK